MYGGSKCLYRDIEICGYIVTWSIRVLSLGLSDVWSYLCRRCDVRGQCLRMVVVGCYRFIKT